MSAIYKEPLSVLKRLLFVAMVVLGMTVFIAESEAADIKGTVYLDIDNDNSYNSNDISLSYLSGLSVKITKPDTTTETKTLGADGTFQFTGLTSSATAYKVEVIGLPGGYITSPTSVTITSGTGIFDGHIAVKGTGGTISGYIFEDNNINLQKDGAEIKIPGVIVLIKDKNSGTTIGSVKTNSSGDYTFQNLPSGRAYIVEVDSSSILTAGFMVASSNAGSVDAPIKSVTINDVNGPKTNNIFAVTKPYAQSNGVNGIVAVDNNGSNGYELASDASLKGATVTLYYNNGTTKVTEVSSVTTNDDGKYLFKDFPLWKYKVVVTMPTGFTASSNSITGTTTGAGVGPNIISVIVSDSTTVYSNNDFLASQTGNSANYAAIEGSLFGIVDNSQAGSGPDSGGTANNLPLPTRPAFSGVTVELYKGSAVTPLYKLVSDTNGNYKFGGLTPDTYTVKISKTDTDSKYSTFLYMNDTDGKSSSRGKKSYEITQALTAGAPLKNQNFWFGKQGVGAVRFRPQSGAYGWGVINGIGVAGYMTPATYTLYEEDGQTIAIGDDGNPVVPYVVTNLGTQMGHLAYPNSTSGIFVIKATGYEPSLTPNFSLIKSRLKTDPDSTSVDFTSPNKIQGTAYAKIGSEKFPLKAVGIRVYRLKADGVTRDYTALVTTTTTGGVYNLTNLPDGKYEVTIESEEKDLDGIYEQVEFDTDKDGATTPRSFKITVTGGANNITDGDFIYKLKTPSFRINGNAYLDIYRLNEYNATAQAGANDVALKDVTITLKNSVGTVLDTKTTQADGSFEFTGAYLVGGQTYKVEASMAGMGVSSYGDYGGGAVRTITLPATAGIFIPIKFLMQGPGQVTTKTFINTNGNGSGLEGIYAYGTQLYKETTPGTYVLYHGYTTAAYTYSSLPLGKYYIRANNGAVIADNDPVSAVNRFDFEVTAGLPNSQNLASKFIYSRATYPVSGTVWLDTNNNNIIDKDDIPLKLITGVPVYAYQKAHFLTEYNTPAQITAAGNSTATGTTVAADGTFSYSSPEGTVLLRLDEASLATKGFTVINNADKAAPVDTATTLPASLKKVSAIQSTVNTAGVTGRDFLVKRSLTTSINGRVYYDGNYSDTYTTGDGSGDTPLAGVKVGLYQGATLITSQETDADGMYNFINVLDSATDYEVKIITPPPAPNVHSAASIALARKTKIDGATNKLGDTFNFWYNQPGDAGLSGSIALDLDGDGTYDPSIDALAKIPGLTIKIAKAGTPYDTVDVSNTGTYKVSGAKYNLGTYTITLEGLPSGYSVYRSSNSATTDNYPPTYTNTTSPVITVNVTAQDMYARRHFLIVGRTNNSPGSGPLPSNSVKNSGISGILYEGATSTVTANRIPGAVVSLRDSLGKEIARSTTNANGEYQFYNLHDGTYKVYLEKTPTGYGVLGDSDTVSETENGKMQIAIASTATTGVNNKNMWFAQASANGIKGKVTYSVDGTGTTNPLDVPVAGITVELSDGRSVVTDKDGNYHFPNVLTTTHTITLKAADMTAGGYKYVLPLSGTITKPVPAIGLTGENFVITGKLNFTGTIKKDTNADKVPDAALQIDTSLIWAGPDGVFGTNAVTGVNDDVTYGSIAAANSLTVLGGKVDSTGTYKYANVPAGNYKISYNNSAPELVGLALMSITDLAGNTVAPRTLKMDSTGAFAAGTNPNFGFEALGGISGQVFFDADGSNSQTAIDSGMNGVTVNLYAWDIGTGAFKTTALKTTTTANDGTNDGAYEFTGIALGRYKVEAVSPAGYSVAYVTKGAATGFIDDILASSNGTAWNLGLKGTLDATLKTRNDSNNNKQYETTDGALPNIQVEVATATGVSPSFKYTVTTGTDGNIDLKVLPGVNLTFTVKSNMTTYDRAYNSTANTGVAPTADSFTMKLDAAAITAGHPFFGYRLKQTGTRTVSGAVVIDTNNNGSYDNPTATPPDSAMTGAKVTLKTSGGIEVDSVAIPATGTANGLGGFGSAKADGTFSFGTTLNNDTYTIEITNVPANYVSKFPAGTTVTGTGLTAVYKMPAANATAGNSTANYQGFVGDIPGGKARDVVVYTRNDNGNKTYDSATTTDTVLNGATVKLTSATTNYSNTVTTVSGAATFTNVPYATDYRVEVTVSTNMVNVYTNAGGNLNVTANPTTPVVMTGFNVKNPVGTDVADIPYFGFLPNTSGTSKLSGRVVFDANNNGIADAGEGINGLILTLYVKSGASYVKVTTPAPYTTAGDGNFTFDNIANGDYRVQVDVAGSPESNQAKLDGYKTKFGLVTLYATSDVNVSGATSYNFGYVGDTTTGKSRNVDTYVRFDTNLNSAYDSNTAVDFPANGYKVTMTSVSRGITVSGTTAGTGKYTFTALPYAADYTATVSSLGTKAVVYNNTGASTSTSVSNFKVENMVTSGTQEVQDKANIPYFGLKEGTPPSGVAEIKGSVRLDSNGNNTYESTDPLLGGVTLALSYDAGGGNYAPISTVVSANGEFTFSTLSATTTYRVEVIGGIPAGYAVVYNKGAAGTNSYTTGTPSTGWHFGYKAGGPNVKATVEIGTYQTTATASAWSASDTALSGINLTLSGISTDGNPISAALTSAGSGKITLQSFPYGTYTLSNGTNSGYVLKYSATGLTVNASNPASEPKWGYAVNTSGSLKITGTVKFDADDDGVADSVISDLKLLLYVKDGSTWTDAGIVGVKTDTNGAFSFENIADKTYRVVVDPASYAMVDGYKGKKDIAGTAVVGTLAIYESKDVVLGGSDKTLDMIYAADMTQPTKNRAVTIEARSDRNNDQKYQTSDDPIKDVVITVSSASKGINITGAAYKTDATGKLVVNLPFAADYKITATKTGLTAVYDNQNNTGAGGSSGVLTNFVVTTKTNQAIDDIPFFGFKGTTIPSGTGTVRGYVVNDKTGSTANQYDSQDTGLGNVVVGLSYQDASSSWISAGTMMTNNAGLYSLSSLDISKTWRVEIISGIPANHTLVFNPAGPTTTGTSHTGTITVTPGTAWNFGYTPGASAKVKDIVLYTYNDSAGTINGSKDPGDTALSGIEIRIAGTTDDGNTINQVYTSGSTGNPAGQVKLDGFPQGTYTITSEASNDASNNFVYSSGGSKSFALNVSSSSPIAGEPYFGYGPKIPTGTLKIEGTVKYQTQSFGTPHATDAPLTGVVVTLSYETGTGTNTYNLVKRLPATIADGKYSFTNLGASESNRRYKVVVESGLPTGSLSSYTQVNGTAGGGADNIVGTLVATNHVWNFGFKGSGNTIDSHTMKLEGYYDTNGTGKYEVIDASTKQNGAIVEVVGATYLTTPQSYTLTSGTYTLTNLPNDTYTITSKNHGTLGLKVIYNKSDDQASAGTSADYSSYTVNVDGTYNSANPEFFGYFADASGTKKIGGRVVIDSDNDGKYTTPTGANPNDIGVNNISVSLYVMNSGVASLLKTKPTGADGSYNFDEGYAANKTYRVVVTDTVAPLNTYSSVFTKETGASGNSIEELVNTDVSNWHFGYKAQSGQNATLKLITRWDNGNKNYDAATTTDKVRAAVDVTVTGGGLSNQVVTTDASGELTLYNLAIGSYSFTVASEANISVVYNALGNNQTGLTSAKTLANGNNEVAIGYLLDVYNPSNTGIISGRVVIDSNASTGVDSADVGLKDVELKLEYKNGGVWQEIPNIPATTLKTNATGNFTINQLLAGPTMEYRLSVVASSVPAGLTVKYVGPANTVSGNAEYSGILNGGTTGDNWNFGYIAGDNGSLTVNARLDTDFSGDKTNTTTTIDPLLAGIELRVTGLGGVLDVTFTSDGTSKVINNLPYGAYTITTNLAGTATGQKMVVAYDPNGGTSSNVSFTSSSTAASADYGFKVKTDTATGKKIEGKTVTDTDTNYANGYSAYNGMTVKLSVQDGGNWLQVAPTQLTAIAGDFKFENLVSGWTYKVEVVNPSMTLKYVKAGTVATENSSVTISEISKTVTANETDWIFAYGGAHKLEGVVTFDTDRSQTYRSTVDIPIPGTEVTATATIGGNPQSFAMTTGLDGRYSFPSLMAGQWTVTVTGFDATHAGSNYLESYAMTTKNVKTYTVNVGPSMDTSDRNFGFYGDAEIHGQVIIDLNGDKQYQDVEATKVLAGFVGYLKVMPDSTQAGAADFVPFYVKVKSDGSYKIEHLVPGFNYIFEAYTGAPPVGAQVFALPANYLSLSYFAADNGSGTVTTRTLATPQGVARTMPLVTQPQYTLATTYVAFSSVYVIDGKVLLDTNGNGVYDANDTPLAGVTVQAYNPSLDSPLGTLPAVTTTTDSTGSYSFAGLTGLLGGGDGKWEISITAGLPAGVNISYETSSIESPATLDGTQTILLDSNKSNVNFGYKGSSSVTGTVQKIIGTTDLPFAGVTVELYDKNNQLINSTSSLANGSFTFSNLADYDPTKDYQLRINMTQPALAAYDWVSGFSGTAPVFTYNVNFASNAETITLPAPDFFKVRPRANYVIGGYVFHDANDNGAYEATETVPAGAQIEIFDSANNSVGVVTPIPANGQYSFANLPAGQYRMVVTGVPVQYAASFDPDNAYSTSQVITVNPGEATINVSGPKSDYNFGYIFGGTVTAVVKNNQGGAYNAADPGLANAEVELRTAVAAGTAIQTKKTDGQGLVTFRNLDPAVTYYVAVPFGTPNNSNPTSPLQQVQYVDHGTTKTGTIPAANDMNGGPVTEVNMAVLGPNVLSTDVYFGFQFNTYKVTVTKVALKDTVHVGEFVPYKVTITSNESKPIPGMILKDLIPAGFKYVKGSARITDAAGNRTTIEPTGQRPIEFTVGTMNQGDKITLNYILVAGSGVTPGDYVNKANTVTLAGFQNSNVASATVKVTGDPLFDDSLIFGKVFHDKNRNGRQDKDEPGVGGVKLVTARGEIITTDEHGRYHLADVSGGRWERGTNFILKLDTRSLPQGLTTTTENPIVVRLSPGLPSRINFGVEVPPPVAARLAEQLALAKAEEVKKIEEKLQKEEKFVVESIHFAFDQDRIEPEFENTLDSLAEVLRLHPEWKIRIEGHTDSLGTEAYNKDLSQRRANAVKAYLLKTGVNSAQLVDAVGLGLSEPVADNGTPEGRYKNRRVEFKLEK